MCPFIWLTKILLYTFPPQKNARLAKLRRAWEAERELLRTLKIPMLNPQHEITLKQGYESGASAV